MRLRLHVQLTLAIGALFVVLTAALAVAIARIAENERGVNALALKDLARRVMTVVYR